MIELLLVAALVGEQIGGGALLRPQLAPPPRQ